MPDNNQTNTSLVNDTQAPKVPAPSSTNTQQSKDSKEAPAQDSAAIMSEVANKIADAHNILVALSSDPSVDEMAAAIGLSLYLDKLGKRATAIYSGSTPNALEFLKPEDTFDTTADTLQDFVIALNKEKADHLRYKLDGDYVKIFITPYRSRIAEEDLEFSYGDFNIDLVLALDVANGVDLDSALREHGRIMHDASVVNITTGNPGKFGEIEWSDKTASSVSEMVARLIYNMGGKNKIQPEEATAFLTGIIAATDRFSKGNTTAETMKLASSLMESGADQQLIAKNITSDINNQIFALGSDPIKTKEDPTSLEIEHEDEVEETPQVEGENTEAESATQPEEQTAPEEKDALLDELKATEASLANAGAETTPEAKNEPVRLSSSPESETAPESSETPTIDEPVAEESQPQQASNPAIKPEKVIAPPEDFAAEALGKGTNKYGQMLEEALTENNPAASAVPQVASQPEINGVPDINYMPLPDDQVLPPPPTPPIDFNSPMPNMPSSANPISPAMPPVEPTPTPLGSQPAMQDQVYQPKASSPDSFKIPGMQLLTKLKLYDKIK